MEKQILVANQKASRVQVYDLAAEALDARSLRWEYPTEEFNIAGIKTRMHPKYGQVILTVYGYSSGRMITYPQGEVVWRSDRTTYNPHTIEYVPAPQGSRCGLIVTGSTSSKPKGHFVNFFFEDSEESALILPREDTHGILWDPARGCLWMSGNSELTAYSLTVEGDTVSAEPIASYEIPGLYAHDLAAVYGHPDLLWITNGSCVQQFDKRTGTFRQDGFAGACSDEVSQRNVKGVGNWADGTVVCVTPDDSFMGWNGVALQVWEPGDDGIAKKRILAAPNPNGITDSFYKCRVFCPDYQ
jgi:hypothetical protein